MFTQATGTVTTGTGAAKQEIQFTYDELKITLETPADELLEWYCQRYSYAKVIKMINTASHRDAGNLARASKRIKPEDKIVHAMAWAMDNIMEEFMQKKGDKNWLLQVIWPQCADQFEAYGG